VLVEVGREFRPARALPGTWLRETAQQGTRRARNRIRRSGSRRRVSNREGAASRAGVLRKNIRFGREPRIVLRNLEETASTAEGFLHHAHRAELVTDPG
jgi:hypothetical protein